MTGPANDASGAAGGLQPSPGISYGEAARAVNYHRGDALVVSTSSALREWSQVSEQRDLDLDLTDCMDRAPAVGWARFGPA